MPVEAVGGWRLAVGAEGEPESEAVAL